MKESQEVRGIKEVTVQEEMTKLAENTSHLDEIARELVMTLSHEQAIKEVTAYIEQDSGKPITVGNILQTHNKSIYNSIMIVREIVERLQKELGTNKLL